MKNFLEKIKPHLISEDLLIQETVLYALHDYPNVPEEWTNELLTEAFRNEKKLSSILIFIENQTINEEAVKILIENIPTMDKSKLHLAVSLCEQIEPELALKYKEQLEKYIRKDLWSLYKLLVHGTEEQVYREYGKQLNVLENDDTFNRDAYIKAKKLAACIVNKGWVTEKEIDIVLEEELKEQWFSFNGILNVYMIGLMNLEKYIPVLAELLVRDEDILLEEVADVLIRYQSDKAVKEVAPYLKRQESVIFASSVIENIKTDFAVQVLRDAYRAATELDDQDLLIEALCHQLSEDALPEITEHTKMESVSGLVDMELTFYGYYSILGLEHLEKEDWKNAVLESEQPYPIPNVPVQTEYKVGRNDPCPCGSGKKYKKCCGK